MLYYGSKLSENIRQRDPEGYLYCLNVPIARTGSQTYLRSEIGLDGEGTVEVVRTPEEVFDKRAISSFEGMPVCNDHPYDSVTASNVSAYGKGHVQNVRRGSPPEDDMLFADIVITHTDLIDAVESGKREISCGYTCDYYEGADGRIYQRAIRGNHVAIVSDGRAGSRVAIRDSVPDKNQQRSKKSMKNPSIFARAVAKFVRDSEPDEGAIAIDEMLEATDPEEMDDAAPYMENTPMAGGVPVKNSQMPMRQQMPPQMKGKQGDAADINQQLVELLNEIKGLLGGNRPQSLDALEQELQGKPKMPSDDRDAVTVPPEQFETDADDIPQDVPGMETDADDIPDDEEMQDAECENPQEMQDAVNQALLTVLKGAKPAIAKLPAQSRRAVSDSLGKAVRKAAGLPMQTGGAAKLARIAAGRRPTTDSRSNSEAEYGRKLMEKYNPHYRK